MYAYVCLTSATKWFLNPVFPEGRWLPEGSIPGRTVSSRRVFRCTVLTDNFVKAKAYTNQRGDNLMNGRDCLWTRRQSSLHDVADVIYIVYSYCLHMMPQIKLVRSLLVLPCH